ncbi:biotin/lipoyl-binding protein [Rhizobium grahamii]|uniref:biotin/lipoyl-binding protein n=1 Tax=Rhizobium grahamii TaxID=1120045 RepID=UPI003CC82D8F
MDDNAIVHKGDVLFTVDKSRFSIALDRADAEVDAAKAALDRADTDFVRAERLLGSVASERQRDEARAIAAKADSDYRTALLAARLRLARSRTGGGEGAAQRHRREPLTPCRRLRRRGKARDGPDQHGFLPGGRLFRGNHTISCLPVAICGAPAN